MKYRVVMGFYPSENSARSVLKKAMGKCKNPRIVHEVKNRSECYVLVLYETNSKDKADEAFSYFMRNKLYCGIQEITENA